jgi:hypothetical protein
MRDLPGLNKFPKVSFSIKMCTEISFKRRGNVSGLNSIFHILFCTKLTPYIANFNFLG